MKHLPFHVDRWALFNILLNNLSIYFQKVLMYPTIQVRPIEVRINSVCSVLVITDTENNKKMY